MTNEQLQQKMDWLSENTEESVYNEILEIHAHFDRKVQQLQEEVEMLNGVCRHNAWLDGKHQTERDSLRKTVEHYKDNCPVCHGIPHNVPFRDSYQVLAECPMCKPARDTLQALDGDNV